VGDGDVTLPLQRRLPGLNEAWFLLLPVLVLIWLILRRHGQEKISRS